MEEFLDLTWFILSLLELNVCLERLRNVWNVLPPWNVGQLSRSFFPWSVWEWQGRSISRFLSGWNPICGTYKQILRAGKISTTELSSHLLPSGEYPICKAALSGNWEGKSRQRSSNPGWEKSYCRVTGMFVRWLVVASECGESHLGVHRPRIGGSS